LGVSEGDKEKQNKTTAELIPSRANKKLFLKCRVREKRTFVQAPFQHFHSFINFLLLSVLHLISLGWLDLDELCLLALVDFLVLLDEIAWAAATCAQAIGTSY